MKEYIISKEYIDGIYTDEGSTFGLDMQKELIRCKDCKYQYTDGDNVIANYCLLAHNRVQPDEWFCADAERKEE